MWAGLLFFLALATLGCSSLVPTAPQMAAGPGGLPTGAGPTPESQPPAEDIGSEFDAGALLWHREGCAACHGADRGEGQRPLSGLGASHSVESLAALLAAPPEPMPRAALDRRERIDLAVYLLARFGD